MIELFSSLNYQFVLFLTLIIGFISISLFRQFMSKSKLWNNSNKKVNILITGPEDTGKTALFLYLRNGKFMETVTSMQPNLDTIIIPDISETKEIELIDYPGSGRLQSGLEEFMKKCNILIFLVDAANKVSIKNAARDIYKILTSDEIIANINSWPILIYLNKCDLVGAKSVSHCVGDLEREIERLRSVRQHTLEGENEPYLGLKSSTFKFHELPLNIKIVSGSVKSGDIKCVKGFIKENMN